MSNKIDSIDELKKSQSASQAQGGSTPNYSRWQEIMEDLDNAGVQKTGSYEGDLRLHSQVMDKIEAFIEEQKNIQKAEEVKPTNNENSKVESMASSDKESVVKANFANATSSTIMADYMKYYHLT